MWPSVLVDMPRRTCPLLSENLTAFDNKLTSTYWTCWLSIINSNFLRSEVKKILTFFMLAYAYKMSTVSWTITMKSVLEGYSWNNYLSSKFLSSRFETWFSSSVAVLLINFWDLHTLGSVWCTFCWDKALIHFMGVRSSCETELVAKASNWTRSCDLSSSWRKVISRNYKILQSFSLNRKFLKLSYNCRTCSLDLN